MRCSIPACSGTATCRVVVVFRAWFRGSRARIRLPIPLVTCLEHTEHDAVWNKLRGQLPRAITSRLGDRGVLMPNWARLRVMFLPLRRSPQDVTVN